MSAIDEAELDRLEGLYAAYGVDSYARHAALDFFRAAAENWPALIAAARSLPAERRAREEAERSLRIVQNAAKTLAACHGTELEHLRQNATYDHNLRAEHESLKDANALLTSMHEAAEARATTAETEAASLRERVKALEDHMLAICSEFAQGHPLIAAGRRLLGMDRLVRAEFKTFDEWAAEARATLEEKPHD